LTHLARKYLIFPTPLLFDAHYSEGTPCDINVFYTTRKRIFMGYNSVTDNTDPSSFV